MADSLHLSELQLDVMRVLWQHREATVSKVRDELHDPRRLANTTVATLLARLEKRELVEHRTDGRQFVYRPRVSEAEVRGAMVGDMAENLFQGDVAAFVCHLLHESEMGPGDVARVRALIEAKEQRKKEGA